MRHVLVFALRSCLLSFPPPASAKSHILTLASLLVMNLSLGVNSAFCAEDPRNAHRFEVTALNSPVKSEFAQFKMALPEGMSADRASYRIEVIQSSPKLNSNVPTGQTEIQLKSGSQGITASIPVDEIAPGKFIAHFKVKPSKEWWPRVRDFLKIANSRSDAGELHGQVSFEIDSILEVPNPGKAGNLTLEGIDSDGDGVRDDVQRWINTAFAGSEKKRRALKQFAKYKQSLLINSFNRERSIAISHQLFGSTNCLQYAFQGLAYYDSVKSLEAKMANTEVRLKADIKAQSNLHGQSYRLPKRERLETFCEFDVDRLQDQSN